MGVLTICSNFFAGIVLLIAIGLGQYLLVLKRWQNVPVLLRKDFEKGDFTVYHTKDIPTVYYTPGKIGDVLPKWPYGEFKLFRVKEGEKHSFDTSIMNSTVAARKLQPGCPGIKQNYCSHRSVFTPDCMFDLNMTNAEEHVVDAEKIITGELPGYHAAFASLSNRDVVKNIWDSFNFPFSVDTTAFEHAFIMNLEDKAITAPFHANSMTDSMAMQLVGRKTWLFLPSSTFVDLMKASYAGSSIFPKQSIPKGYTGEVYVYTGEPGDILFFPESWGHVVYTHPGPNLLMNYRGLYPGNFLRQPVTWLSSLFELKVFGRDFTNNEKTDGGKLVKEKKKNVPFKKENVRVQKMYMDMCEEGPTGVDAQLMSLLEEEMAQY